MLIIILTYNCYIKRPSLFFLDITSDTDDMIYFIVMNILFKSLSIVIIKRNFYGNKFHNRPVVNLFCLIRADVAIIN